MLKQLLIFTLFMLGMAGICHAQDPTVWRKVGAVTSSEGTETIGLMKLNKNKKGSMRVLMIDTAGIIRDTSVASLTADAVKYADSNLYATQYDLTSGLAEKVDTSAYGILVYNQSQYKAAITRRGATVIVADSIVLDSAWRIADKVTIKGIGRGKGVLAAASDNTSGIITAYHLTDITIADIEIYGSSSNINYLSNGYITNAVDLTTNLNIGTGIGVLIDSVQRVTFSNVRTHNFNNSGVKVINTGQGADSREAVMGDLYTDNCYYGINFTNGGQYCDFKVMSTNNVCGVGVTAGNVTIRGQITNNSVNVFVGNGINSAHGAFIGCLINHAALRNVYVNGVSAGEIFMGCHFYERTIEIVNSSAVQIMGGVIQCPVIFDGNAGGFNTIHDVIYGTSDSGGKRTELNSPVLSLYNNKYNNTTTTSNIANANLNNDLIAKYNTNSSTEIEGITHEQNSTTTGFYDFRYPLVSLSGGILITTSFEGDLYPATKFKLDVQIYANNTASVTTAYLMGTFTEVNGTLPFTKVSAAIAPDGQVSIRIGDTNTAIPISRLAMTRCTFWNTGTQGTNMNYVGGKWTSRITNTNVGFTSPQTITTITNLNTASSISGAQLTAATVPLTKLSTQSNATIVANISGGTNSPTAATMGNGITATGSTLIIDTTASNIKIATQGNVIRAIQGGTANLNDISATSITSTGTLTTTKPFTTRNIDATSGSIVLTLSPSTAGQVFRFVRLDNTGNTVTIQMSSGNINGAATNTSLNTQYSRMSLVWNGTNSFLY